MLDDIAPLGTAIGPGTPLRVSPTDIAQFLRVGQCERYLRLRLHERHAGRGFLEHFGVEPQAIPPMMTRAGRRFEEDVEAAIAASLPTLRLAARGGVIKRDDDNRRLIDAAATLPAGRSLVLFQPRLAVELEGWIVSGDIDLLRLRRDDAGALHLLIADIKSSPRVKVEHRLQVAFYHAMAARLLDRGSIPFAAIRTAILYRGPAETISGPSDPDEAERLALEREQARETFGTTGLAYLEIIANPQDYLDTVGDLVTGSDALARRVAAAPFDQVPFALSPLCDDCLYNEFCMKSVAQADDLSLLPTITAVDKQCLHRQEIRTVAELAVLKDFPGEEVGLTPAPGREGIVRKLSATWPIGPRLDELVHRARRYRRWKKDELRALSYIPNKGYTSLPYCDAGQNPNLVRIYVDAQQDYLNDRIYLLGALVAACRDGVPDPDRRRTLLCMTKGPPDRPEVERDLFVGWTAALLKAVVELAAPDPEARRSAPIHFIFFDSVEQRLLLDGLARNFPTVLGATPPLYDFLTQLAAFDSPIASFLDREIRDHKNYPMTCQSLQAVAAYLEFDWNSPQPFREIFRARMFDFWARLDRDDPKSPWYTHRARFGSRIPLEYAYTAWGELPTVAHELPDRFAPYRPATVELLTGFQARRLEALEHVAADFPGNKQTQKRPFALPELGGYEDRARSLAQALDEFVTIERHVELNDWKATRHAPPERRVLMGETLLVRYSESDQDGDVADALREIGRKRVLRERHEADHRAAHPDAPRVELTKEQKQETKWTHDGLRVRLRLDLEGVDCELDEVLAMSNLREGDYLVAHPRWGEDERLPANERAPFTPTPKQMLYGPRAELCRIAVERDEESRGRTGFVEVAFRAGMGGAEQWSRGFVFSSIEKPLVDGALYTLDSDPNSIYGYWCAKVVEALRDIAVAGHPERHALYARMAGVESNLPSDGARPLPGQERFLAGLEALHAAGLWHDFEPSKRAYIGGHGRAPILLVQGPPGTGKSHTTAFALFARLQGALEEGRPFRALVSCKTHSATDVLLREVAEVRRHLADWRRDHPKLYRRYFDDRLPEIPLFRIAPREQPPEGVVVLPKQVSDRPKGEPRNADRLLERDHALIAATPGGVYATIKDKWGTKSLVGHALVDCLVLDEASQMGLPEAMMAALPLAPEGQLIVVGDPRQMPPIVKHEWATEPRRTFEEYKTYASLFEALTPLGPPLIQFTESFRLHATLAEFLRREVYEKDGIAYHSNRREILPALENADPFVAAVLAPEHPLVAVVHDESRSQTRNDFERELMAPLLEALADPARYGLDPLKGLGVVVPHRAQRAALLASFPGLSIRDPETGVVLRTAVDTVERFQGDERSAIIIGATESDRAYLLAAGEFLYDPRRLTVALSRAKRKLILVGSRSVFTMFSPVEETFADALLWKNLLRRTCTLSLWEGERAGQRVKVWGCSGAGPGNP